MFPYRATACIGVAKTDMIDSRGDVPPVRAASTDPPNRRFGFASRKFDTLLTKCVFDKKLEDVVALFWHTQT